MSIKYEIKICTYAMNFAGSTVLLKNQSFKLVLLITYRDKQFLKFGPIIEKNSRTSYIQIFLIKRFNTNVISFNSINPMLNTDILHMFI